MDKDLKVALKISADGKGAAVEVERVNGAIDDLGTDAGKARPKIDGLGDAVEKVGQTAPEARKTADAVEEVGNSAKDATVKTDSLVKGMKGLAGAAVVREFIQANASLESIGKSLEAVTGSSEAAAAEMEFIRNESNRLGIETEAAAKSFLTFAAATKGSALEGDAAREIWSAFAGKMSQLGASTADVEGAMVQLAQGASKGKFELEDLKSITERIPGAMDSFAKSIGVSKAEFYTLIEAGEITADMLPRFAAGLDAPKGSIDTFNANLARMKNALTDAAVTIGDTGIFSAISSATRGAAFGVTLLVSELVLIGKTLGNMAYSVATLDFSGFLTRQNELIDDTTKKLGEAEKRILGTGEAAKLAGDQASQGFSAGASAAGGMGAAVGAAKTKADTLADSLKDLGLKIEDFADAGTDAAAAFENVSRQAQASGDMILTSLLSALNRVSNEAAPGLEFALQEAFQKGKISAEQLEAGINAINTKAQGLWDEMDKSIKQSADLAAAYTTLGITSQAEMDKTAASTKAAYQTLVDAKAPVQDLNAAWQKYAEATIKANQGVASETLKADAAARGFEISVDKSGKAAVKAMGAAEEASKKSGAEIHRAGQEADDFFDKVAKSVDGMRVAAQAAKVWADELALAAGFADTASQKVNQAAEANRTAGGSTDFAKIFSGWNLLSGDQQAVIAEKYRKEVIPQQYLVDSRNGATNYRQGDVSSLAALKQQVDQLTAQKRNDALNMPASAASTNHQVTINLAGRATTINAASAADANNLANLFQQLQDILNRS